MRVLVTGGAGYIGSVVTAQLLDDGHQVTVLDDLSTGHADAVPDGARFVEGSIDEAAGVLGDVDAVIHFAAKSLVGESTQQPDRYWHNNVVGTLALLDAMRAADVSTIVFSSSAATYGDVDESPITEQAPNRPTSPYGATKLAVDLLLADYCHSFDLAAVSLRYFNVAGAMITDRHRLGERHPVETHLIPNAIRAAAGDGAAMKLFGTDYPTPDGTCVRDYIHVVDLGEAHLRALTAAQKGRHLVLNLGSGTGYSVRQVIDTVGAVTGRPVPIEEAGRRAGDPAELVAGNARAGEVLGWQPRRDLHAMVEDAWTFHREQAPGEQSG
jgi:UDP-glucose 4-epimerase